MKKNKLILLSFLTLMFSATSCVNDLDVTPIDPSVATANTVFQDPANYKLALSKLYASYAVGGQQGGGGGKADIKGIDENFGNYLRQYFSLQELPTDEAVMAWDDGTVKNFHNMTWAANDKFVAALYSRIFFTVSISNELIRNTNTGIAAGVDVANLKAYQAEARFIRAFSYYHAIDMFGNVPFVTEADLPGAFSPRRIERAELFKYIESELLAIEGLLLDPRTNVYGRVDKAAAWMLLSKLYLNAKVYTGVSKNTEALTYAKKVIGAGYTIEPRYENLFRADNNKSNEIIFPICFDGLNTQGYGGMTFITHACTGAGMPLNGIDDGGWGGIRTIKSLVTKFGAVKSDFSVANPTATGKIKDQRGMFFFDPKVWSWDISNVGNFTEGVGVSKFKNLCGFNPSDSVAPNKHATFVSVDFPMFRLGDAYLIYAEAVVRGGEGGDLTTAVGYVNQLQDRAGRPHLVEADLTLPFLLEERARELYHEAQRRTDLIRFNSFTEGSYLWELKGGVSSGAGAAKYRDIYPIPVDDMMANPNLIQNTGY